MIFINLSKETNLQILKEASNSLKHFPALRKFFTLINNKKLLKNKTWGSPS